MQTVAGLSSTLGLSLGADNSKEFWNTVWEKELTIWKRGEVLRPYTRNIYAYLQYLDQKDYFPSKVTADGPALNFPFLIKSEENTTELLNGEKENAIVKSFLKGKRVAVPLCGDTTVIPYLAESGAALVVGADLSEAGLAAQREHNFPGVDFTREEVRVGEETVVVFEATVYSCVVRLFQGDFMLLPQCPAFTGSKIDFVYDRASFMAVNPALRASYVKTVASVLTEEAVALVERPARVVDDRNGPPFSFSCEEINTLYETVTGRKYNVEVFINDPSRSAPEIVPGTPVYHQWLSLYPKK
ncbi:Thiopurine S-methyltransferase (TPMT), putative [Angomonas deanei]|uniref:Thiopurine S-methyltransferase (TPMT), putative n=1 Tax=Angomonas deanei TaxID=59799 RepID=A0A7G2CJP1_9TRYP|nr:Thiopurine S-methyltransferase (TPMT), putative [Angomonas deanei]